VRGRLDAREVEGRELLDMADDRGELLGHPGDLLVGQAQPRQPGNVQDVVRRDRHRPAG